MNHNYNLCNPPSPGCPNWENIMYEMSQSELLEYTSKPYQTGPDQFFPLLKKIISNESAKEKLNSPFKEVIISEEKYDSEKIKGIYNDLFYSINKKGKKSHTSIIEQSTDRVYPEININLDDKISSLEEKIEELSNIHLSGSLPQITPQHPIYNNGILVQNGNPLNNIAIDPEDTIFYLQQGFKRPITTSYRGYYIRMLRQAEGEIVYGGDGSIRPLNESPQFRFLSNTDLNLIPNGEDISEGNSLNLKTITDQGPNYTYDEMTLEFVCEGVEKFYKYGHNSVNFQYNLDDYDGGRTGGGYWWLDKNASCKMYIATPDNRGMWVTIGVDGPKTIRVSRSAKWYGHEIGGTTDPLDSRFYDDYSFKETWIGGYGVPLVRWQMWGENKPFPQISRVSAGSRLNIRVRKPFLPDGTPVDGDGKSHKFNASIDGEEEAVTQGVPNQAFIFNSQYDQKSIYGTRMINQNCVGPDIPAEGCYGDLHQDWQLQRFLEDPNFGYYREEMNGSLHDKLNGKRPLIYGQPILKVNGKFAVFLWAIKWADYYANFFQDLENDDRMLVKNKEMDPTDDDYDDDGGRYVSGYRRDSKYHFNWVSEGFAASQKSITTSNINTSDFDYINNPTLYFPGLRGANLNTVGTNYDIYLSNVSFAENNINSSTFDGLFNEGVNDSNNNVFNPEKEGSNYEAVYHSYRWGKSKIRMG